MDPSAFDTVARSIAQRGTRRGLVRLVASLPLVGFLAKVGAEEAAAERPIDRLRRRTPQRNRKQRNKNNNQNNNNNKKNKNNTTTKNTPQSTQGQCTAKKCPQGCCAGRTCAAGDSAAQCGTGGVACQACATGQRCVNGACVCDTSSGCSGCCAGGSCVPPGQQTTQQCGSNGAACAECGTGLTCLNGGCFKTCSVNNLFGPCGTGCTTCHCDQANADDGPLVCVDQDFHVGECDSDADCPAGTVCDRSIVRSNANAGDHLCVRPCPCP